ncbi:MAG TPA: V-type ATP synthase subunit E family protein [Thermoplasmata archaeon]
MGLDAVIEEILSRGRAEVEEARKAAQAERERLLDEARSEGTRLIAEREQGARAAAERVRVQELARAELEARKIVLAAQKGLLDEVHAKVLERLATMGGREALLRKLLDESATEWRAGEVYGNARDAAFVRSVVGAKFGGTIDCAGGIVIESSDGTRKTDLRFESILADVWRDSIRQVAEVLWPPS